MNNKEFREEIKTYIDDCYDKFNGYQQIALEILIEFDRVCGINQLDYYLAYGTLIGAIRDSSQIPWDYDIDTFVKIDDRERLLSALNKDLGDGFYYDYSDKNPTYPTSCLRICKKGYSMMALHVDVFFLIGTPNNEKKRARFLDHIKKVIHLRTLKNIPLYIPQKDRFSKLMFVVLKLFLPVRCLNYIENRLFHKYKLDVSDYWCANQTVYKKVYPKDIFATTTKVKVNDHAFSVPVGYEEFLSLNYGDWHKYFPVKSRFEEFYNMLNIIEERHRLLEQQK